MCVRCECVWVCMKRDEHWSTLGYILVRCCWSFGAQTTHGSVAAALNRDDGNCDVDIRTEYEKTLVETFSTANA